MDLVSPIQKLINSIYPPRCVLCQKAGFDELDLCSSCYQSLPWNRNACVRCALPLPETVSDQLLCGRCLNKAPLFDASTSLFRYEPPVVTLIQQMKFNEKLAQARLLTQLLTRSADDLAKPECLLPVPLHNKRLRQRGFNQSIEISRPLATLMDIPLELNAVLRVRETEQQTGLDAKARRKNIKGAFEVVRSLPYEHVAIVDDVVTTGSTVNELARVLKKAGVKRVEVFSLARAPLG